MNSFLIADKNTIKYVPNLPGVYKFYDRSGNIIYVGKSISLRNRLYSYFVGTKEGKSKRMALNIYGFTYEVHDTHLEAMLRECELIKILKPHFNAQLKNDDRYLYLELNADDKRGIIRLSRIQSENTFGPFRSRRVLENLIGGLSNLLPIERINNEYRFAYDIFPKRLSEEEEIVSYNSLYEILSNSKLTDNFIISLESKMLSSASELRFERAEFYKDLITNLTYVQNNLDRKREFINSELIYREKSENGYKYFIIRDGEIVEQYYFDEHGVKYTTERKVTILKEIRESDMYFSEKSDLDFKEILYREVLSNSENTIRRHTVKDINKYIEEVFNNRYTCKGYDPEKSVSDEDFKTIIEAGRLSPSSFGFEPWKFIRLKNKKILEEIKPHAWGAHASIEGASHFVLILARMPEDMNPSSEYIRHIQSDVQGWPEDMLNQRLNKYTEFREEDFDLNISERAVFDWTTKQVYIPLANMLTVAAMLEIDSTPMEGFHQERVHEILVKNGVYDPKRFKIAVMVAFGYTNREHRPKTRRCIDEVFEEV